jgi:Tat protein translocase TatB subunit
MVSSGNMHHDGGFCLGAGAGRALLPTAHGSIMNRMGFSETIFLFFLALLIFGPKKLPEIARQVGKALNEFRRASNEFKAQLQSEISQLELENQHQILPPAEPPAGSVAKLPEQSPESTAEPHTEMKVAPDA